MHCSVNLIKHHMFVYFSSNLFNVFVLQRRRGLWDQPQPQKRKRAAKKAARTRRENATKAARRVTPTLISTTTTGESLETYLPKRDLIKLHNVVCNVFTCTCGFISCAFFIWAALKYNHIIA